HHGAAGGEIFAALTRGDVWRGEFLVRRRDGSPFHAMVTDTPILDPEGKLVGVIGVSADISDLKRKEGEIRALNAALEQRVEERTEQLMRSNEALKSEIEQHLRAQEHLRRCIRDLEASRDKISQQSAALERLVGQLREARVEAESANRLKSRFLASMSHEIRTPNGVLGMTRLLLSTPLQEEQRQFVDTIRSSGDALLTILNDILDLSKIEAGELELEHRDFDFCRCLEDAVSLLAVRFRLPLSFLFHALVCRVHASSMLLPFLVVVVGHGERVWAVIRAMEKGVAVVSFVEPNVPRVILVNLISNAIKFTEKGEVEVTERMKRLFKPFSQVCVLALLTTPIPLFVRLAWLNPPALAATSELVHMVLRILKSDFNIACSGSYLVHMFFSAAFCPSHLPLSSHTPSNLTQTNLSNLLSARNPYFSVRVGQVDVSMTRKYGGTGLGLAISHQLVGMLGGRIWAESDGQGRGSTFRFYITAPALPFDLLRPCSSPAPPLLLSASLVCSLLLLSLSDLLLLLRSAVPCSSSSLPAPLTSLLLLRSVGEASSGEEADRVIEEGVRVLGEDPDVLHSATSPAKVILLVPYGSRQDFRPIPDCHVAVVTYPIRQTAINRLVSEDWLVQARGRAAARACVDAAGFQSGLAQQHPLKILLAEDNLVNQKVATKMLGRMGYTCHVAVNGAEVLQALQKDSFDLVFMDVQMPVMDGIEATQRITHMWPPSQRPKIFAMTANVLETDRAMCMQAGMDGFISSLKLNVA
ncbi:unnamed protein product, partial [Closterium sp. NIES-64]